MIVLIVAFYLMVTLYGFSKACTDIRLFWSPNKVSECFARHPEWLTWYIGGNANYPPGQVWTADWWHFWEHIKDFCVGWLSPAFGGAILLGFYITGGYNLVSALQNTGIALFLAYWYSGRVFVYFSHYGLRLDPDGNFGHFLKDTILFWRQDILKVT